MDADADELSRLRAEVESLRAAVQILHRVSNLLREPLEVEATLYAILTGVTAGVGLGFNRAILFVEEGDELCGRGAVGPADGEEADRIWRAIEGAGVGLEGLYEAGLAHRAAPSGLVALARAKRVPIAGDSPVALALREARVVCAEGSDDLGGLLDLRTCVAAPLRGRKRRGVLYADNRFTARLVDETTAQIFGLVAEQAGRAVARARVYEHLEREARTDALTALANRGSLDHALDRALQAARLDGQELGLAMIDLDDFKRVNDTHGHPMGDAVLVGFAERARGILRRGETLYRYGGEEFVLLMPDTDAEGARAAAERLRRAISQRAFGDLRLTCSVGVAAFPRHARE
ncbi:MAG: sensor domain-containing diguanylate cyclase, partial [Deltaproteobacteria bacterium]|nr:sensor domain-containing diguanylate cyclase [Deltaproteobacteria bacterium]